jgi:hypothetical protein
MAVLIYLSLKLSIFERRTWFYTYHETIYG